MYHLYHFDPLQSSSKPVEQRENHPLPIDIQAIKLNLNAESILSPTIQDQKNPKNRLIQHIEHNYNTNHSNDNKYKNHSTFNISTIIDGNSYSVSIQNHYYPLYTNKSYMNQTFHHIQPKCIRQHTEISMCYISDCHDTNPQFKYQHKFPNIAQKHLNSNDPELNADDKFWSNILGDRITEITGKQMYRHSDKKHAVNQYSHQYAMGTIDAYNNDIDEENAGLPTPWDRYRANIKTIEPYKHLIYRPDIIRDIKSSKATACFVSHQHKFVFVHVLKAGGTSMSGFLCYALCNVTVLAECDAFVLHKSSCKKIKASNPEYFYFAIVRNPYNRMFSLWSHYLIMSIEKAAGRNRKLNIGERNYGESISEEKLAEIERLRQIEQRRHGKAVKKLDINSYTRSELLKLFAEFVWERRFIGLKRKNRRRTGVSSDHMYEQHWWLFNNQINCPIIDFIGHLENIEYDIQYIINLMNDNKKIMDYYIENGEYWKINTYGSNIKGILYNNTKQSDDGLTVNSLSDIYKLSTNITGINVKRWTSELYEVDFHLFGYDVNKIENNLLVNH